MLSLCFVRVHAIVTQYDVIGTSVQLHTRYSLYI